ncbi:myxochelin non-ribosomal peptide synthetase MxcG [Polyangium aurulentum]|uniref:myxochelin non-ribosomal peptide synthetase MxcG n=1 Tax=Polyangium aurulentum TaxID=2567896 RepID=UPI0010AE2D07|nr:myxochelin non-ribosomal peptide synthetase MxcG [Polyangium aurulentum]UQA63133.1 myxochelin non-ribosomal peptide synthetase MxcG [Polyangium aurulentum]
MPGSQNDCWPLSAAQHGIWLGQELDPTSPLYNAGECIEIRGALDLAVFEAALRQAITEAETLHMRFSRAEDGPRQLLDISQDWPVHRIHVGREADLWAFVEAWMRADLERTVDLHRGPLFAEALFTAGPDLTYWYQRAHHIALDGFGFSLVAQRVAELYTARTEGRASTGAPSGSLLRVVQEDLAYRSSPACERDRAFWLRHFDDRPAIVSLGGRSAMASRSALRRTASLALSTMNRAQAEARSAGASWPDVIVAAIAAYAHRITGAPELVLGLPVMGRMGSVSLRIPSMVMNIVPLRVPVPQGASLSALVQQVAAQMRAIRPHMRYRHEQLRRNLKLVGGNRRLFGPVVNIMPFDYDLRFAGRRAVAHNISAGPVEDISINVYARSDGREPRIDFDANPDCYSAAELEAHQRQFLDFLAAVLSAPAQPIAGIAISGAIAPAPSAAAQRPGAILDGGPLPAPPRDVIDRILENARERPDAIALEHGSRRMTYGELERAARRLSARLTALGAGPGTLVALSLPRSVEAITAIVATLFSGAGYLPLDPQGPSGRTAAILADAGPALLVTLSVHAEQVKQASAGPRVVLMDDEVSSEAPEAPIRVRDEHTAYVIYTSGSTGRPNGVVIGRGALAHFVAGATHGYDLRRDDRVLQFAPLHFDASVEEVFLSLCAGATLVLRTEEMLQSVLRLLDACAEHAITVLDLPTALWHEVAYSLSTGAASLPLSVRTVIIGGEAALPERVARFRRAVGPAVRLLNTYGPTEATVVATFATLTGIESAAEREDDVPIGRPLPGVRAAVIGADGRLVAQGEVGELYLMGGGLAEGYLGQPELSAARFQILESLPHRPRAYRTGDLVRQSENGQLVFVGRVDEELKISGHRVDPGEIETVLLRHPGVREVAVVGSVLPGGTKRLSAHIVADAPPPSPGALRQHAQSALPPASVPSAFMFTDRLPRTSTGKIDRAALRDAGASRSAASASATTDLEKAVMEVWEQVLGVDDLSVEDDFFERGGQSLQTIQVATRLGIALGREIPVAMVFRHPTIADLSRALGQSGGVTKVSGGLTDAMLADAVLPDDIVPALHTSAAPSSYRHVLLTGATGFVGVHLLRALLTGTAARVVCLVRAADEKQAADRLLTALKKQGLSTEHFEDRVEAVPADLSLPRLGLRAEAWNRLAMECDAIYHDAAVVSLVRDYRSMCAVNVLGTREILRLAASARPKPVHHVSTLAVAPSITASPEVREGFVPPHPELRDGYKQSKWIAERLAEQACERGLPVAVYRLGRVVGAPETGIVNEQDLVFRLLLAGIPAGVLPALDVSETWTPVDYVARAIVQLSLGQPAPGTVFNLAPAPEVQLEDVFRWVGEYGYGVESCSVPAWRARLGNGAGAAESATLAFFDLQPDPAGEPQRFGMGRVCCDNVIRGLSGSGIDCPAIDRSLVFRYLDHCVETGKLPRPSNARAGRL